MSNVYYNEQGKFVSNDNLRVIKRNLVYVIGLDPKIANKETLLKNEYLGQYGKITKLIVNVNKAYTVNSSSGPTYSAYINYSTDKEAATAILSVDSTLYNGKVMKAAFGTTKYCTFFLRKMNCPNRDCVYIHTTQEKCNLIDKESNDFYIEQHKMAIKISDITNPKVKDILYKQKNIVTVFPNPYTIYSKKNIIPHLPENIKLIENKNLIEQKQIVKKYTNNQYDKSYDRRPVNNKFQEGFIDYSKVKTVIKEINYDDEVSNSNLSTFESNNTNRNEDTETTSNSKKILSVKDLFENQNTQNIINENKIENEELNESDNNNEEKQNEYYSNNNEENLRDSISDENQFDVIAKIKKINKAISIPNCNYKLFKPSIKSKFLNDDEDPILQNENNENNQNNQNIQNNQNNQNIQNIEFEENAKIIQQYYIRNTFSNLISSDSKSKKNIEDEYFSKFKFIQV